MKVDSREDLNIPPFGYVIDYMTYGGIYRDVYLDIKNKDHIEDIFIRTDIGPMDGQNAELISEVTVQRTQEGLFLKQSLKNKKTGEYQPLGESEISGTSMQLSYPVENVMLWELEHPELYEVKTELICDGTLMDERVDRIGFRRAEFKKRRILSEWQKNKTERFKPSPELSVCGICDAKIYAAAGCGYFKERAGGECSAYLPLSTVPLFYRAV